MKNNNVGRPKYQPKFPSTLKWTFDDWCVANEIDPKTGKGKKCSSVTLNNFKKSDMYTEKGNLKHTSIMVEVKGELANSKSVCGLGRKMKLYMLRENLNKLNSKTSDATVEVNIGSNDTPTIDPSIPTAIENNISENTPPVENQEIIA